MTARHDDRADDAIYRDVPGPFAIGQRVLTCCGVGIVEHIAYSHSMQAPLYTVAIDPRMRLRLLGRDLKPIMRKS